MPWNGYTKEYNFRDGYTPTEEAMDRLDRYLAKLGYSKEQILIGDGSNGTMEIYAVIMRFGSVDFIKRFETTRRITLGNMCEIDIVERPK